MKVVLLVVFFAIGIGLVLLSAMKLGSDADDREGRP